MDIRLQRVEPDVVHHIEQRAAYLTEKTGVNWTRNDYVKLLIGEDYNKPLEIYKKKKFDEIVETLSQRMAEQEKTFQEFMRVQKQMMTLLLYGGDDDV